VDDPSKYGVVVIDEYGQVQRFVEKPKVRQNTSPVVAGHTAVDTQTAMALQAFKVPCRMQHQTPLHAQLAAATSLEVISCQLVVYLQEFVGDKINAGIYVLAPSVLDRIELRPTSIEREVFPHVAADKKLFAFTLPGYWMVRRRMTAALCIRFEASTCSYRSLHRQQQQQQPRHRWCECCGVSSSTVTTDV
jgi:NDP-sugar pyrophosphorylase family protein